MQFISKNKTIIFFLFNLVLVALLIMLSFPLYKFFFNNPDYNELTQLNDNKYVKDSKILNLNSNSIKIIDRKMKVKFIAEVEETLEWNFVPLQEIEEIKVGKSYIIKYEGKNLSNKTITATADFNALPEKILPYLIKTECFCFIEQTLEPGQSQIFSMVFFLDSALDEDSNLNDLKDLSFTYKFSKFQG